MSTMEMPTAWVDVLQSQLDDLVATDNGNTFTFGSESTMLGFYHYTTLIIREWIMVKSSIPKYEPDLRRYQVYQRCINSIKAWLDLFFAMPLRLFTSVPCSMYSQLCYVMVFLHQITTTREAAWNPVAAQEIVDLFQTADRIIHTFEQLKSSGVAHSPGDEDQSLSLIIKKFQNLKKAWQSEIGSENTGLDAMQGGGISGTTQDLFATETMDFYNFDLLPNI
ncbi:hypothetical protein AB5N19_14381 [Seiridium cardinale]